MRVVMRVFFLFFSFMAEPAFAYSNEYAASAFQFLGYRPSYFLAGQPNTKVQLSLKTKFIQDLELHVAYTQLMFWDLFEKSSPFHDLNYNPEVFYRFHLAEAEKTWIDLGYQHESNGRDGPPSRSWDRLYLLYSQRTPLGQKTQIHWSISLWVPVSKDLENNDIIRYRGLWEANVTLLSFLGPFFERNDLTLRFFPGGRLGLNPLQGGRELTFRFNNPSTKAALPVLTLQVFQGQGEGLLDYRKKHWGLRGGFGF